MVIGSSPAATIGRAKCGTPFLGRSCSLLRNIKMSCTPWPSITPMETRSWRAHSIEQLKSGTQILGNAIIHLRGIRWKSFVSASTPTACLLLQVQWITPLSFGTLRQARRSLIWVATVLRSSVYASTQMVTNCWLHLSTTQPRSGMCAPGNVFSH